MKNKEATKETLLKAVEELVIEEGFEKLGVNAVASRAGVSKMLIYRYFDSLDGLIAAYIKQFDFWMNYKPEFPDKEHLGEFLKKMYREQIRLLRSHPTLRRLYRWELTGKNKLIKQIWEEREKNGKMLVDVIANISGRPHEEVAAIATLTTAAITHLVILEENCPYYSGIPLYDDKGWKQLEEGMNHIIDNWLSSQE